MAETAAAFTALRLAQARCYRAITSLEAGDAVAESGYRNLSRLLNDHVRIDDKEATRLARHARSLAAPVSPTGVAIDPELPATAAVVTAGTIGPGHVEVIRTTMRRLAAVIPAIAPDILAVTETQLAQLATTHSPAALAEAATAILALLDPDGTAPEDTPPPPNELHYLRRRNGALVGKFTYRDPAAAEALHTALCAATPPPEPTPEPPPHGEGPRGESYHAQGLPTLPERRAHGLLDLAAEALTRGLDIDHPTSTDPRPAASERAAEDTTSAGIFDTNDDQTDQADQADEADQADQADQTDTPDQADATNRDLRDADAEGTSADGNTGEADASHTADTHESAAARGEARPPMAGRRTATRQGSATRRRTARPRTPVRRRTRPRGLHRPRLHRRTRHHRGRRGGPAPISKVGNGSRSRSP